MKLKPGCKGAIPDYKIAGANCNSKRASTLDECKMRHYKIDGGTCLRGASDIYIHCSSGSRQIGYWGNWTEETYVPSTSYFRQQFRNCFKNESSSGDGAAFCKGSWLELIPDGLCMNDLPSDENYNAEFSSVSDSNSYYYDNPLYDRAITPLCACQPDTNYSILEKIGSSNSNSNIEPNKVGNSSVSWSTFKTNQETLADGTKVYHSNSSSGETVETFSSPTKGNSIIYQKRTETVWTNSKTNIETNSKTDAETNFTDRITDMFGDIFKVTHRDEFEETFEARFRDQMTTDLEEDDLLDVSFRKFPQN